jgi:branched-chain amino acid transport system substrate-binding protein
MTVDTPTVATTGTAPDGSTAEERAHAEVAAVNAVAGEDAVPIGIITPLTGPGDATAGELVVRGACLGAEYARTHLGRSVRFVVQNDQASAAAEGMQRSAVGGVAKLAMVDDVVAALGQWHLRTTPWVAETANRLGLPIFIENGHSTVTAEGRRMVFRTYYTVAERSRMMVDFMTKHGIRRIAILAADTVFGLSQADTLQQLATGAGIEVLRFDFPQETTEDLREQLTQVRDFAPDLIVNDGVVRTNYLIIRQAEELGLRPSVPMMVTFGYPMRSQDFWRNAGPAGNGIIWPATHYRPSWPGLTEIGQWFTQAYRHKYGSFPPDTCMSAFTDVTLIVKALDGGPADRTRLVEALESRPYDTWRGPVRFTAVGEHLHHDAPDICLMQYHNQEQDFDDAAIIWPPATQTGQYLGPDELH